MKCKVINSESKAPASSLIPSLKKAYEDKIFTDFEIICENKSFKVHRFMVATRSVELLRVTAVKSLLGEKSVHHIKDISSSVVEALIRLVYIK
jgi:hypothetical protein